EWYAYCGQRYQSFDPRSGYFMGYNGVAYFCR
ncbi:MAG TPA: BA14K family protein, partial [Methyloceanibacter sp.]|nr:BA14K family protein [Methyloceanibacter sp.]